MKAQLALKSLVPIPFLSLPACLSTRRIKEGGPKRHSSQHRCLDPTSPNPLHLPIGQATGRPIHRLSPPIGTCILSKYPFPTRPPLSIFTSTASLSHTIVPKDVTVARLASSQHHYLLVFKGQRSVRLPLCYFLCTTLASSVVSQTLHVDRGPTLSNFREITLYSSRNRLEARPPRCPSSIRVSSTW